MGEAQEIPVRNRRSSDNVRRAVGQAGAVGEQAGLVGQAIALPDDAVDVEPRTAVIPFEAIGDACAVLEPVVTVEAVDREKIAVLEVEGARILVRNVQIIDWRGRIGRAACREAGSSEGRARGWPYN